MKRNHKHADMIRRWLDDDSLEVEWKTGNTWTLLEPNTITWDEECDYRFKSKMIKCGDLEFPEPMRVAPIACIEFWTVDIRAGVAVVEETVATATSYFWCGDAQDVASLRAGICHLTRAAAEQHARALIALTTVK